MSLSPVLPTGTVAFFFTDIEGSTRLWEHQPEAMRLALARHDGLLRLAIERHGGHVFKTIGDAFCASFATASQSLAAALDAQQALEKEPWGTDTPLRVRIALHSGAAEDRGGDYFGPPLNRLARLLAAGHGGQVLLSLTTQELTRDCLPPGVTLQDLGEYRLRDLERPERIFQLLHPDLPRDFPPLRFLNSSRLPNNLPQQVSSFIGRKDEAAQVEALLGRTRLLTLTGMGGTGKTRLALQVASNLLLGDGDGLMGDGALTGEGGGVWFVELAPLADPALVSQAVAQVLGVREEAGRLVGRTLTEALKERSLLLVLDNCEHVLNACAILASDLLRACPQVHILASSREALGVAGEQTYRVPSLSLPDPKRPQTAAEVSRHESVRLFVERARQVQPSFAVTDENAPAVAAVCRHLDGIPLAIELASARVRSLAVEEINVRLGSRFRLLTGGSRTALPRQQTLRALIDWSYDLLLDPEKAVLASLSVFAGDWDLRAAEAVCTGAVCAGDAIEGWEVMDLVTALADKSLLVVEQRDERMRYRLLETVRQYAADRLLEGGGGAAARARHRDHFLGLAEEADAGTRGPEQAAWLDRLEAEHDNLRAALDWCREDGAGAEAGLRLAKAMYRFWRVRGYLAEGRERLAAATGHLGAREHPLERASALRVASGLEQVQGNLTAARALAEEALALFESTENARGGAGVLLTLGNVALMQDDLAGARAYYERGLPLYRLMGEQDGVARALGNLGAVMQAQGDLAGARTVCEESLAFFRGKGDAENAARALGSLGEIAYAQGEDTEARARLEEALALFHRVGARNGSLVGSLCLLGTVALRQGRAAEARTRMAEGLTLAGEIGEGWYGADALEGWAKLCLAEQRTAQAARLWGAAAQTRRALGLPKYAASQAALALDIRAAKAALGEAAFAAAWAEGEGLTWEQAVQRALADG